MWRSDDDKQAPAQGGKGGTGKQEWDKDRVATHGEKREPHDDRHGRQRGVGQRAESGGGARSRRRAATSVAHGLPAKRDRQYVRKFSRRVVADGHDVVRRCQNNGDDGKCRGPAAERRPECPIDRPAHPRRKCQIEEARRQANPLVPNKTVHALTNGTATKNPRPWAVISSTSGLHPARTAAE